MLTALLTKLQGYETAAGLGKTGYNLASGLGGAVSGGGQKAEKTTEDAAVDAKQAEKGE